LPAGQVTLTLLLLEVLGLLAETCCVAATTARALPPRPPITITRAKPTTEQ